MQIKLNTELETKKFGQLLADAILQLAKPIAIFMTGELGSGKTSLTRFLVQNIPNGDQAEISSPSFTIANRYPTKPQIWHFDLYRCENLGLDDSLEEIFDSHEILIVEWSEYLQKNLYPEHILQLNFEFINENARIITIKANGENALFLLKYIENIKISNSNLAK